MGNKTAKSMKDVNIKDLALPPEDIEWLINKFQQTKKKSLKKEEFFALYGEYIHDKKEQKNELSLEELTAIFKFFDSDHSGDIDVVELLTGCSALSSGDDKDKAALVFKAIDLDDNGTLEKEEIIRYIDGVVSLAKDQTMRKFKDRFLKENPVGASAFPMVKIHVEVILKYIGEAHSVLAVEELFSHSEDKTKIDFPTFTHALKKSKTAEYLIHPLKYVHIFEEVADYFTKQMGQDPKKMSEHEQEEHVNQLVISSVKFLPANTSSSELRRRITEARSFSKKKAKNKNK